ncbi:MAG: Uma2 family endonuclease [Chloroflexi bacterium]|nr:Uma2 family endonuclease [Chloroflexota bacterium]
MTTNPQRRQIRQGGPMSVEEYLQLDRSTPNAKYEYLNGVARLMSGGSVGHDRIARNVAHFIEEQFLSGPCTVFGSDVQVLIGIKPNGQKHYVYPDTTVSCDVSDRRRDNLLIRSPRIVVEVLSPSTEKIDHGEKLEAYKSCPNIQEIVLINQFAQYVEIYRRNGEGGSTWSHVFYGPDSTIELFSVDVCLSMDEIYKGINFDEPLLDE